MSLRSKRNRRPRGLCLEALDPRWLMAANLSVDPDISGVNTGVSNQIQTGTNQIVFDATGGVVEVTGDDGFNEVTVDPHEFPIHHIHHGKPGIKVVLDNDGAGAHEESATFLASDVNLVVFHGLAGNDFFTNNTDVPSEAHGNEGIDTLIGGSSGDELRGGHDGDFLYGNGGPDTIYGASGDDVIEGNARADVIYGGDGDDTIDGGNGDDVLYGGEGSDSVGGGKGDDELYGDPAETTEGGEDILEGDEGNDTLQGGAKGDVLDGGEGDDDLWGQDGPDHLLGKSGNDEAWGGQGGDLIEGGNGEDTLRGGDGPDRVYGGGSNDELFGGPGNDGIWGAAGTDELTGGDGADRYLMHEVKDEHDSIATVTDQDVVVTFENGDETKTSGVTYGAAIWADDEIMDVDAAFAEMVKRTGDNTLLRRKSGKELTFIRVGNVVDLGNSPDPFLAGGWNSNNGKITLTGLVMSAPESIHQTVFHEIAHNWDKENDDWGTWKGLSGWKKNAFGNWTHDTDAVFARDYGETNPMEDFATTFAAVFMFGMGETYSGDGAISSLNEISAKESFMNDFLDEL